MNKYKFVAAVNFFLGIVQGLISISYLLFTLPQLMNLYSEINAKPPSYVLIYLLPSLVLVMALGNFFIGLKLLSKLEENKDKYLTYGIILIITTFVLVGLFVVMASLSALLPIYNLKSGGF